MPANYAIPVNVTLDRGDQTPLDLTPMLEPGSLSWSSVVPGGFASCGFQINGDFRRLVKLLPYLSIVRVVGDSGRVLFEGQIEDLQPTLSLDTVGVKVGAFGLQNALKEQSVRAVWSKRDMQWDTSLLPAGATIPGAYTVSPNVTVTTGQFDPTNLAKTGARIQPDQAGAAISLPNGQGGFAMWVAPVGVTLNNFYGLLDQSGGDTGTNKWEWVLLALQSGIWSVPGVSSLSGVAGSPLSVTVTGATALIVGAVNASGATITASANDVSSVYDMRVLAVLSAEDVVDSWSGSAINFGGFYGDTLIKSLLGFVPALGQGNIESVKALDANPFAVDHLDASVRRVAYDILTEIASYYSREWAVWENGLLDWRTPNLQQNQWLIPLSKLDSLDLDASVVNSKKQAIVLYTDAASQQSGEATAIATDRRNPYVLKGRAKDVLVDAGLTMTPNTAAQLAAIVLQDLGFGPVPASGTVTLPGETIIDHASGRALKAWEIRAGDNVTIPELPMSDVFTQDGRGEVLFHVVSAEANPDNSPGNVVLTLDSYGSKRSDVLMARLAAVTNLLGG